MRMFAGVLVSDDEYKRLRDHYEEVAFQRGGNQGELSCPMIISDGQRPLQSMADGKIYDSKSEMRKGYKQHGVEEVGNDVPTKKAEPSLYEKKRAKEKRRGAAARALSQAGFGAP